MMQSFNNLGRLSKLAALGAGLLFLYLCFFGTITVISMTTGGTPTIIAVATTMPNTPTPKEATPTSDISIATNTPEATIDTIVPPSATPELTATPEPTATAEPTETAEPPSPTPTLEPGVPTPTLGPEAFNAVTVTTEASSQGGIKVAITLADGTPKTKSLVRIYEQKADISSNPIRGNRLAEGRTDDSGQVFFALEPGTYSVQLLDYVGQLWGEEYDYTVTSDKITSVSVAFGQIGIGVIDADGKALEGRRTRIYLQKTDISGNSVRDDRIAEAQTDNTGSVLYQLTSGMYAVQILDLAGYPWSNELNHPVLPGQRTNILLQLGRLTVGVRNVEGKALESKRVRVYLQKVDVGGNAIQADRILEASTDNTGVVSWNLTEGLYAIEIRDIAGNLWGEPLNHQIKIGETNEIILTLGRLSVALKDPSGNPITDRRVRVSYQKRDVGGNIVQGDRFLDGRTDNTGQISWDITAGNYMVEVQDIGMLEDVPIRPGVITVTNGDSILSGP